MLRRLGGPGKPRSASKLAAEIGLGVSHVSYHCKTLHGQGLIEVERRRPVRGAQETFYHSLVDDDAQVRAILAATAHEDEGGQAGRAARP